METAYFQPSWPIYMTSSLDYLNTGVYSFPCLPMDIPMDDPCEDSSSGISFDSYLATLSASPDSHSHMVDDLPYFSDEKQATKIRMILMEDSDCDGNVSSQLTSESESWTPQISSPPPPMEQISYPNITLEMEKQHSSVLSHLLWAYGEAVQNGHQELTEVIVGRVNEIINPLGEPMERVAFNLFQSREAQGNFNYLRQQSDKNLEPAFQALYQWYPYGRFAHFSANSAILQAMPTCVETVHIMDFDMGEGIQWPPLIEAMSRDRKAGSLRITSVKSEDDDPCQWNFEDTKRRLHQHTSAFGISLIVEEMGLDDLVSEIKKMKKSGTSEWLAFNLMVGLPHMGRQRSRNQVSEFLNLAKDLVPYSCGGNKGIITFGDGEAGEHYYNSTACPEYSSFFNKRFKHFQALFESMESDFPVYLPEARIAMESLFVSPYVSSKSWFQQWEATKEGQGMPGLLAKRMSRESLTEAQQIVNQRGSSYKVVIQGNENEMVLQWKDIPLVKVSSWSEGLEG